MGGGWRKILEGMNALCPKNFAFALKTESTFLEPSSGVYLLICIMLFETMSFFGVPVSDALRNCATREGTRHVLKVGKKKRVSFMTALSMKLNSSHLRRENDGCSADSSRLLRSRERELREAPRSCFSVERARPTNTKLVSPRPRRQFLFPFQYRTAGYFSLMTSSTSLRKSSFFFQLLSLLGRARNSKKKKKKKNEGQTAKQGREIKKGKTSIQNTKKKNPRTMHSVKSKTNFFLHRDSSKREKKPPSYSLYKCRAGASVADQIDFYLEVTKRRHFFFSCYKRAG